MKRIFTQIDLTKTKLVKKHLIIILFILSFSATTFGGVISGAFTSLSSSPVNLSAMIVDPSTGYFYAVGDHSHLGLYRYNVSTDTWTTLAAPPHQTGNNAGGTLLNGKYYVSYTGYADLEVYTIATDSWTTITGPSGGTYTGNISNDGTDIYVCNGTFGSGADNLWKYVVSTNTWTALSHLTWGDNSWGGLQYKNGYFYHDRGDGQPPYTFDRYNVSTNTWETLPDIPGGAVLGSAIYDAYYYCMGNYGGTNLYSYDLGSATWNNTLTLPWPINDATICVYGNALYIIQGEEGTGFAKFTPNNPILTNIEGTNINYTTGSSIVNVTSTIVASQNEGVNFQSATATVSSNFESGSDVLAFTNANGITGSWNSTTGVLTLTGTTSIANYQAALRTITYSYNNIITSAITKTISFQVYDGTNFSNTASRNITMVYVPCTPTAIGSQSTATQTQCLNGTFTPITLTATGAGTITYQWYSNASASNSGGTSLGSANGAQTNTYTPQTSTAGTNYYYCVVHSDCGVDQKSAVSGAFIVNPATTINSQSTVNQTQCINGTFTAISVSATGTGTLTYQWYSNTSASNSGGTSLVSANGAQTNTYTPQASVAGTKYYYCVVHSSCGADQTSAVSGAFIVNSLPVPNIIGPTNICNHTTGNVYTTEAGMASYNWNVTGGTITAGAGTNSITVTWNVEGSQSVSVNYANANGCTAATATVYGVTLKSAPNPVITGSPSDTYIVPKLATYQYSTPLVAGDLYSWSSPKIEGYCSATARNCVNVHFLDPCCVYGQWTINVTETNPTTGCSTIATKLIYITP